MTKQVFRVLLASLVLMSSVSVWAQVSTATLSGTVTDSGGAVLPGTQVAILNEGTGNTRTLVTDTSGRYSAPALGVGSYRVTATHEGFQGEIRSGVVITVGREAVVDFNLNVGKVSEQVEVKGDASVMETTSASLGSLVSAQEIRNLPLNGRSYEQLALLQPGVTLASPGPVGTTSQFSFGTGKRFSVGGQRSSSNSFLLDGTTINDQANGTPGGAAGTNLGVDTIEEFRVVTNSFKAEYGHSSGAVITAVTRTGTNSLHGTAFEYLRNSALDARNYFDVGSSPPTFRRNQFGGVVGGPIKKDKTFFFAGYEGLRQGLATTQTAIVPTALTRKGILPTAVGATTTVSVPVNSAIVPYLNLYPLPNGKDFGDGTGQYFSAPLVPTNEDNFMGRVDHQLNSRNSLFARYVFDNDSQHGSLSIPNLALDNASRRQYSTLQLTTIVSDRAVNNFRFAYNRSHSAMDQFFNPDPGAQLAIIPGQKLGTLQIGGISSSGARALTPLGPNAGQGQSYWAYNVYQYSDDFSYQLGKHAIKTGIDIERFLDNTVLSGPVRGSYTFSSLNNFLAGKPSNLQASSPLGANPEFGYRQALFALYGQDDFKVNSRLTLNLGFRWEAVTDPIDVNGKNEFLPTPLSTQLVVGPFTKIGKKNFEPRGGVSWMLDSSGKTVLRTGGGIYHNQILPWLYSFRTRIPPYAGTFNAANPPFPNGYTILQPGTAPIALQIQAPVSQTPVVYQYNLSIERQLLKDTVLLVAYAGNKANHMPMQVEENTPVPTIVNGQPVYAQGAPRRNTAWSSIRETVMAANSNYNSLTTSVQRKTSHGLTGQVFYTFSKALDNASNLGQGESQRSPAILMDPTNFARDWSLSDYDARHSFGTSFSYALPMHADSRGLGAVVNGWTWDGIATVTSGMPFTVLNPSAISRDGGTTLAERPNLVPGFSNNPTHGVSAGCSGIVVGTPVGNAVHWYDPCAFSLPTAGTYGNLGRNTLIGPGVADVDMALEKSFKPLERLDVKFRAEMFNVLNHANFGIPGTSPLTAAGTANASAGQIIYTTTSSRQLQFALRLSF